MQATVHTGSCMGTGMCEASINDKGISLCFSDSLAGRGSSARLTHDLATRGRQTSIIVDGKDLDHRVLMRLRSSACDRRMNERYDGKAMEILEKDEKVSG